MADFTEQYGVLICVRCHNYRRQDILLSLALYALVPCHLFVAYLIEILAARHARAVRGILKRVNEDPQNQSASQSRSRLAWRWIGAAHGLNATLCLLITSSTVFWGIRHPMIGTCSELHAIIVWLKICSYAFTNRDLRRAWLRPQAQPVLPELYARCPYPTNIALRNLSYFWWAPTLCYQPFYSRSNGVRWDFVLKRLSEAVALSVFIRLASAQYAAPLLRDSLQKVTSLEIASIIERIMKLSTISSIVWLAAFFATFQSTLNALAEILRFGDREFFTD